MTIDTDETLPRSSAWFLLLSARRSLQSGGNDPDRERRLVLIGDLYIKAHSYMILNKIAFWLSLALAGLLILWPTLGQLAASGTTAAAILASPVAQTSLTALAALFFTLYGHYKKRQVVAENLMRRAFYTDTPVADLSTAVVDEMERLDLGFTFGGTRSKADDKPN